MQAFLDHRHGVLVRRTRHRLGKIEHRLEMLGGYLVAYANLDEVIRVIREADDAKAEMMTRWRLTEVQAEAILNMRLRALRRLDEIEIRRENEALTAERGALKLLLGDEAGRWRVIAGELRETRRKFGGPDALGTRRTDFDAAPAAEVIPLEAMIEREPVTVICSEKGWIRVIGGHAAEPAELKYKEGDRGRFLLRAETTDKLIRLRHQRACVHARGRQAGARARPWRAGAPDDRAVEPGRGAWVLGLASG